MATPTEATKAGTPSSSPAPKPAALPGEASRAMPDGFPPWAKEFAELYYAGTTCLFILHGNVHDLLPLGESGSADYGGLPEFLATQLFGAWDLVLRHDLSQGLRVYAGTDVGRLRKMTTLAIDRIGEPKSWPRDPDAVLALLDQFVRQLLMEESPERQIRLGIILDYAQFLIPAADLAQTAGAQATRLVRLLSWAQNPYIKRHNIAFCLLTDQLAEMNERLVVSSHVAALHIPMPDRNARERFASRFHSGGDAARAVAGFTPAQLAELTSGLNLVNLERLLSGAGQSGEVFDLKELKKLKKGLIERQARGLVEFVEPSHTLGDFVGNDAVRHRLEEDTALLLRARLDAAPMGYLVCGPVGTGKTYLAECFAGSVGIPCVKLRNFRSRYVGETEANLEQVLTVLRAMGPVVVIIDEADAALGNREAGGDSGTSSRVFSMIAAQMGDTRYRGMLVWMLLTSRPDLLPIDLKRQGRAEVHLPLFAPRTQDEITFMVRAMARKNRTGLAEVAVPPGLAGRGLSGADIESIVLAAKRRALGHERERIDREDLAAALDDFIPSAQGLEKEKQELAAVLECTSMSFLPLEWQERVKAPDGRTRLQERMAAIRRLLEE